MPRIRPKKKARGRGGERDGGAHEARREEKGVVKDVGEQASAYRWDEAVIESLHGTLKARLHHPQLPDTTVHRDAHASLTALLKRGICSGESQSVIVMGPTGAGKSTLVRCALENLRKPAAEGGEGVGEDSFIVININGFVHHNDAVALKHIASKLMVIAEDIDDEDEEISGSAAETSQALREALRGGSQATSKCIVFVVEEMDLFAHTGQQTLLYTLLDHIHHSAVPIVVVGITRRMDIYSMFEKRVLSRFSQRFIHIVNPWKTFQAYKRLVFGLLTLPEAFAPRDYRDAWNASVTKVADSAALDDQLTMLYSVNTTDLTAVCSFVYQIVSHVTPASPLITLSSVYAESQTQVADCKVAVLLDLSALEMCLVIAMNNLRYRGSVSFNFEAAFQEYRKFAQRVRDGGRYKKSVALKAFENLCDLEVVALAQSRHRAFEHSPITLLVDESQVQAAVRTAQTLSMKVVTWARTHGFM